MSRPKVLSKKTKEQSLKSYKFETSNYVIMKSGARRDSHTGRLIADTKTGKKLSNL
jgi:hypothetical protein